MGWTKFFRSDRREGKTLMQEAAIQVVELEARRKAIEETMEWWQSTPPWLRKKEDYIDVEGHVVPDVKEVTNGSTLDEDLS